MLKWSYCIWSSPCYSQETPAIEPAVPYSIQAMAQNWIYSSTNRICSAVTIHAGLPLQQIEQRLFSNHVHRFYSIQERFEQLVRHQPYATRPQEVFPHFDDVPVKLWKESPTRHSIAACYLLHFWDTESAYNHKMCMTTLSSLLIVLG